MANVFSLIELLAHGCMCRLSGGLVSGMPFS